MSPRRGEKYRNRVRPSSPLHIVRYARRALSAPHRETLLPAERYFSSNQRLKKKRKKKREKNNEKEKKKEKKERIKRTNGDEGKIREDRDPDSISPFLYTGFSIVSFDKN